MLLGLEVYPWRAADPAHLDVVRLVVSARNIGARQVWNDFEHRLDLGIEAALGFLTLGEFILQSRNLRHQFSSGGLVLGSLRLADLLRGRVPARLRLLQRCQLRTPLFVQGDNLGRQRVEPARLQSGVKSGRVLADPFDVEHGRLPSVADRYADL